MEAAYNTGCDMRKKITRFLANVIVFGVIGDFLRSVRCVDGICFFAFERI